MKRSEPDAELLCVALSLSPNVGAKTLDNLLRHFNRDVDAILAASPQELQQVRGIGKAIAREIREIDLNRIAEALSAWRARGLHILTRMDPAYPERLNEVADRPPALIARGCLGPDHWQRAVGIVGTRNPSSEARYLTLQLAMQLARAGYTVVSGLALGVDTAAHAGALSADGKTVAVLGSGVLNVYPKENTELAQRIRAAGAILSELHPRCGANAQRLVSRNRIISGLSKAVIVVESNADGGAMYTARFAHEQGRPVYTCDLPADGNQQLIKDGAYLLRRDDPLTCLFG